MQLAGAILTVVGGAILFLVIVCVENPRSTAAWCVVGGGILLWILLLRAIVEGINDSDMSDSSQTTLKIIVIFVGIVVGIFLFVKLCNDGAVNIVTGGLLKNEVEKEQFKNEVRKAYGDIPEEDLNLLWSSYDSPILTSKKIRPTEKECYEFLFTLKLRELKELSDAELEERLGYAFRVIPLSSYLTSLDAKTERKQCAQMFVLKKCGYSVTPFGCFLMVYRPGIREHNYPKIFQKYMDEHPEYKGMTLGNICDVNRYLHLIKNEFKHADHKDVLRLYNIAEKEHFDSIDSEIREGLKRKAMSGLFSPIRAEHIRGLKFKELSVLTNDELCKIAAYNFEAIPVDVLENSKPSGNEYRDRSGVALRKRHAMLLYTINDVLMFHDCFDIKASCVGYFDNYYLSFKEYIRKHPEHRIKKNGVDVLRFTPDMTRLVEAIQVVYPSITQKDTEILWLHSDSPVIQLNERDVDVEDCYEYITRKKIELQNQTDKSTS